MGGQDFTQGKQSSYDPDEIYSDNRIKESRKEKWEQQDIGDNKTERNSAKGASRVTEGIRIRVKETTTGMEEKERRCKSNKVVS